MQALTAFERSTQWLEDFSRDVFRKNNYGALNAGAVREFANHLRVVENNGSFKTARNIIFTIPSQPRTHNKDAAKPNRRQEAAMQRLREHLLMSRVTMRMKVPSGNPEKNLNFLIGALRLVGRKNRESALYEKLDAQLVRVFAEYRQQSPFKAFCYSRDEKISVYIGLDREEREKLFVEAFADPSVSLWNKTNIRWRCLTSEFWFPPYELREQVTIDACEGLKALLKKDAEIVREFAYNKLEVAIRSQHMMQPAQLPPILALADHLTATLPVTPEEGGRITEALLHDKWSTISGVGPVLLRAAKAYAGEVKDGGFTGNMLLAHLVRNADVFTADTNAQGPAAELKKAAGTFDELARIGFDLQVTALEKNKETSPENIYLIADEFLHMAQREPRLKPFIPAQRLVALLDDGLVKRLAIESQKNEDVFWGMRRCMDQSGVTYDQSKDHPFEDAVEIAKALVEGMRKRLEGGEAPAPAAAPKLRR